jgi:hypothetical protein
MKVLLTKNQGSILLCERELIRKCSNIDTKKIDQKKPIFTFAWRVRMDFNVATCKSKMHLS